MWLPDAPKNRTPLIAGIIAAVVALAAIVVGVLYFTVWSKNSPAESDDAQIRAVVGKFEAAWNDDKFDAFKTLVCKKQQNDADFNDKSKFESARDEVPTIHITIVSTTIKGDKADVVLKLVESAENKSFQFVREDGAWKWCE
jgi:hypothetical protein